MIELKVGGLPDLKAELRAIPDKLRKRALRNALAAGARVVQRQARAAAPVLKLSTFGGSSAFIRGVRKPGTLRKAISVRTSKVSRRAGNVGVFVNVRPAKKGNRGAKNPNDPFYWRFVNFGYRTRGGNFKPGQGFLEAGAARLQQALQVFIQQIRPQIEKLNKPKAPAP